MVVQAKLVAARSMVMFKTLDLRFQIARGRKQVVRLVGRQCDWSSHWSYNWWCDLLQSLTTGCTTLTVVVRPVVSPWWLPYKKVLASAFISIWREHRYGYNTTAKFYVWAPMRSATAGCFCSSCITATWRRRPYWVRPWIQRLWQLREPDAWIRERVPGRFHELLTDGTTFHVLQLRLTHRLTKQDTNYRQALKPGLKLATELRCMASGSSYQCLSILFPSSP